MEKLKYYLVLYLLPGNFNIVDLSEPLLHLKKQMIKEHKDAVEKQKRIGQYHA